MPAPFISKKKSISRHRDVFHISTSHPFHSDLDFCDHNFIRSLSRCPSPSSPRCNHTLPSWLHRMLFVSTPVCQPHFAASRGEDPLSPLLDFPRTSFRDSEVQLRPTMPSICPFKKSLLPTIASSIAPTLQLLRVCHRRQKDSHPPTCFTVHEQ